MMLSTMCGHGMVSHSLAKKMIDWVKEGRRTRRKQADLPGAVLFLRRLQPGARKDEFLKMPVRRRNKLSAAGRRRSGGRSELWRK